MTRQRLENIARFHLARFSCSVAHLRRLLLRRIDRAIRVHGGDRKTMAEWVDDLLERLTRAGALNDRRYAAELAGALGRKGRMPTRIRATLQAKGVERRVADAVLKENPVDADMIHAAALAHAQRRKLGQFRERELPPAQHTLQRQKDLAALVRAGFPYAVAAKILAGK